MKTRSSPRMRWLLVLIALMGTASFALSQNCDLTIQGRVLDSEGKEPLPFASVYIDGIAIGTTADENGQFRLQGLCPDHYTLVCTHIGYQPRRTELDLHRDTTQHLRLHEDPFLIEQVIVKDKAVAPLESQATVDLEGRELATTQGLGLGEALESLPGINSLNTGSTISKPVIQGLHSNRILILNNGVRQESQQWGIEHAPEIDPFLAEKITVIKGAGSIRYGGDALGGVILVQPAPLPDTAGWGGELSLQGMSNGQVGIASGMVEGRLREGLPLSGRLQGTAKRGGNQHTPDYFLDNTGLEEYNFSWNLGWDAENFQAEAFYSRFYTRLGIFSDSHIGNVTDLLTAIERERPPQDGSFSYDLDRPLQRVVHELFKLDATTRTGELGELQLTYTRQFNRRQEFDAHRSFGELPEGLGEADIEFEITTHSGEGVWEHRNLHNLRGQLGFQLRRQVNTTDRGALIPNYDKWSGGVFWTERWKNYPSPWEFEAGLRYDYEQLAVEGRQGNTDIDSTLNYNNLSGNLGLHYRFPKWVKLRLHLGSAWRAPHVSELYSRGVHHGSASYEEGSTDLIPERSLSKSLTVDLNGGRWGGSLTLYHNRIDDFIFLEPQEQPELTIRGAFPAFRYRQTDARLMGGDWNLAFQLPAGFSLETGGSLLRARDLAADEHLIFMPADRFRSSLQYDLGKGESKHNRYVRLTMINVLEQSRVPEGVDFAPPPPGHTRFQLEAGFDVGFGKQKAEIGLSIYNLTNVRYREYLNRFRYFAHETGRNVALRLRLPFNF